MRKILVLIMTMVLSAGILTGCASDSRLTVELDKSLKGEEVFVAVIDGRGKDVGGGNVMSGGPLMLTLKDGTYTVKVTGMKGGGYEIPEPAAVTVKGDTSYVIKLEEKIGVIEETADAPSDEVPETIEIYEPGPEETETEEATEAEPEAETEAEEILGEGDVLFDEKEKAYAEILDTHKRAIAEGWDLGTYMDNDMSELFRECTSEDEVGFELMYFDDSEYPMLLVGTLTGEEYTDMLILDAYYLHEDGTMDHVLSSGGRFRYYWMPDEAGPQLIAYEGSSSAATSYFYYYMVDDGKLKCVQGIVYDYDADPDNPCYQVYEDNFSIEGGEKISEEYAADVTEEFARQYRKVPYRPLSEGYSFLAE